MKPFTTSVSRVGVTHRLRIATALGTTFALLILSGVAAAPAAAQTAPGLGTATSFAILAGSTITNTGSSTINGDLGLSPGSAVTGFPPGVVTGTSYVADTQATAAQGALTTAYQAAASQTPSTAVTADLGGQTLVPGVYASSSSLGLTGTLTLNFEGDPNAVFVFQAGSTLTTASDSHVVLENDPAAPNACNVFWQVGSSATLGSGSTFEGTVLASDSVTAVTGAVVYGRLLASTGAVTLDDNTVTVPTCTSTAPPPPKPAASTQIVTAPSGSSITLGSSVTDVATVSGNAAAGTPMGSVQFYSCGPGATSCTSSSGMALTPPEPLVGGVATSPSFTPGAVGTYCFAAVFNPTGSAYAGVSETGSTLNGECLTVTAAAPPPPPPAASTQIVTAPSSTSITLGSSVTDVATVAGNAAAGTPMGSVQFYSCGPGATSCTSSSGMALTPAEPLVGGVATSPSFTPGAVGTYCFAAVFNPTGSAYAGVSETGSTLNGECLTVTAAAPKPPAPKPSAPKPPAPKPPAPPTVVPATHTGEPWAGSAYWLLVGLTGIAGLGLATNRIYRRRANGRIGS